MNQLNQYEGNSTIMRHEQEEARIEAIRECDEGGVLPECPACGEKAVEKVYKCRAANSKVTDYCYTQGKRGCLWRMTDRCAKAIEVNKCSHCGNTEELA